MQQTKVFLAAMVAGVLALGAPAHAGSGDVLAPLEVVSLHGSPCHAQAHRIGGSAALFACEFDPALKIGLAGMPRFEDDVTASLSVLEAAVRVPGAAQTSGVRGYGVAGAPLRRDRVPLQR